MRINKKEKLTDNDLLTIANIIGECSTLATMTKENGVWYQSNMFAAANERSHIFAVQE